MTHFRWVILAVVFVGTTLNFLDRSIMGVLATPLQEQYGITDVQYGYIQSAFAFSYGLSQSVSGGLLDRFGNRLVYAVALAGWSIAAMLHALVRGAWGFRPGTRRCWALANRQIIRPRRKLLPSGFRGVNGLLHLDSSTPAQTWGPFSPRRRCRCWRRHSAGNRRSSRWGRSVLVWLCVWIPVYRSPEEHPRVSPEELALIHSDPLEPTVKVPWLELLRYRQTWAFGLGNS